LTRSKKRSWRCAIATNAPNENRAHAAQERLTELDSKLKRVANNMALADNDEQHRAMKAVFEELRTEQAKLPSEIRSLKNNTAASHDSEAEVEAAMQSFETLDELVKDASNLSAIGECIKQLNIKSLAQRAIVVTVPDAVTAV
jgi:DNA repair exonuclease SbcCD ATPase subunit